MKHYDALYVIRAFDNMLLNESGNEKSTTDKKKTKPIKDRVKDGIARAAVYVDKTVRSVTEPVTSGAYRYKQNKTNGR